MKTIFETATKDETITRLERLQASNSRLWGKMNAAQMLAHCSAALEMANGTKTPPRVLIGWVLGPFFKTAYLGEKPFPQGSPTDKSFIMSGEHDFEKEKAHLLELVRAFADGGEAHCTRHSHAFFGPLTPKEWGIITYKHLDHHLRQFSA